MTLGSERAFAPIEKKPTFVCAVLEQPWWRSHVQVCINRSRPLMICRGTIVYRVVLLFAFFAIALVGKAQYPTNVADLLAMGRSAKHDTTKAQALLHAAVLLRPTDPDSATALCAESMRIVDAVLNSG